MPNYSTTKIAIPSGLDDIGYRFSLSRFPNESLDDFRNRILAELRSPSEITQVSYFRELPRQLGLSEVLIGSITLALDADGLPLAPDAYLEVTSTKFKYYANYASGVPSIDLDLTLVKTDDEDEAPVGSGPYDYLRSTDRVFHVVRALQEEPTLDFTFIKQWENVDLSSIEALEAAWLEAVGLLPALHLEFASSADARHLIRTAASTLQVLPHAFLENIRFENLAIFKTEQPSIDDVTESGDYYVDFSRGLVYSHDEADGYMSYTFKAFPYSLVWQPVRAYPYADPDLDLRHKDKLVSDDGTEQPLLLNREGVDIANRVLKAHSLGWGK